MGLLIFLAIYLVALPVLDEAYHRIYPGDPFDGTESADAWDGDTPSGDYNVFHYEEDDDDQHDG